MTKRDAKRASGVGTITNRRAHRRCLLRAPQASEVNETVLATGWLGVTVFLLSATVDTMSYFGHQYQRRNYHFSGGVPCACLLLACLSQY